MPDIHYKADMMSVIPAVFWLAMFGAAPEPATQPTPVVLGQPLLAVAVKDTVGTLQDKDDVVRAQSHNHCFDDPPEFVIADPCPRGIHRELAYELLDTFNPMSKTTIRILPG